MFLPSLLMCADTYTSCFTISSRGIDALHLPQFTVNVAVRGKKTSVVVKCVPWKFIWVCVKAFNPSLTVVRCFFTSSLRRTRAIDSI